MLFNTGLGIYTQAPPRTMSVPGARSQTTPTKSVAFHLGSDIPSRPHADPGYETDDNDSTINSDGHHPHRGRHHHQCFPSVSSSAMPHSRHSRHSRSDDRRTSSATCPQNSTTQSQGPYKVSESESDSTIDLPDRFDSHGHLLPEPDPTTEKFEDFMKRFARVLI